MCRLASCVYNLPATPPLVSRCDCWLNAPPDKQTRHVEGCKYARMADDVNLYHGRYENLNSSEQSK